VKRDPYSLTTICRVYALPDPIREYRFHPTRRWRFDYAWPGELVALEVEGAVWVKGRHTRGSGFIADLEKYNAATALGWRVVRFTPQQMKQALFLDTLATFFRLKTATMAKGTH
jgi:hypothetical protein